MINFTENFARAQEKLVLAEEQSDLQTDFEPEQLAKRRYVHFSSKRPKCPCRFMYRTFSQPDIPFYDTSEKSHLEDFLHQPLKVTKMMTTTAAYLNLLLH